MKRCYKLKKFVLPVILISFGLVAGLTVAEIMMRIANISFPKFHTIDDTLGFVNNPGVHGWFTDEGRGYVEFNSEGMRGPEYAIEKPAGVFRVAVLGDSYTSALQVMFKDSFPAIVEKQLASCTALKSHRIEVMNFGVSGYGTAQELILLREKVLKYSPDMVVLSFLSGNDLSDNYFELDNTAVPRPYFKIQNGQLVENNSFQTSSYHLSRKTWKRKLYDVALEHLRTIQLMARLKHLKMEKDRLDKLKNSASDNRGNFLDKGIYGPPETPDMVAEWKIAERLILEISNTCRQSGSDFLLVTLTNPVQVSPKNIDTDNNKDLFYPEKRLRTLAETNGLEILTLAEPFKKHADINNEYLHGFGANTGGGHWNEKGHALAGKLITEKICAMENK